LRRSRLEKVAVRLVAAVGPADVVDLLFKGALSEARERLTAKGIPTRLLRGDPRDGDFPCLKGELDGIRFDVLPQLAPVDWENAPEVKVGGVVIRIVDLRGLLALKFRAGGPQDLLDAAALVLLHPEMGPAAERLAMVYGVGNRLSSLLGDARLRAQILDPRR
jgi:hypothetical protein